MLGIYKLTTITFKRLHSQTHNIDNNETPNEEASPLMKDYITI